MTFIDSIGVGLGVGFVNAVVLFFVLTFARTNAKKLEKENRDNASLMVGLMQERNDLDQLKINALEDLVQVTGWGRE